MNFNEKFLTLKRALFEKCYSSLNPKQREAVFTVNNPLLVLAGAGSGKTTVLVKRVVFLIKYGNAYYTDYVPEFADEAYLREMEDALADKDVTKAEEMLPDFTYNACPPYRVLAITFTNKAAKEIKDRLASALDDPDMANDIWAGTFHSICMRILRANCEKIGYKKEFTIYDADDTKKAISSAMKRCYIDEKQFPIKSVIAAISRAKDKLLTPEKYAMEVNGDFRLSKIARVYEEYQKALQSSNAMDFDDIIVNTVKLFRTDSEVLTYYQKKFKYICVDEYQDTNEAQFVLTALLAGGFRNIMVVGDDDQSIYKFRGATIGNILDFDKTYSDAKVIKLEQNYRSTATILDAANAVIANNKGRKGKQLWTDGKVGEKIVVRKLDDQNLEAKNIVDLVYSAVAHGERQYRDFAVLYRTNAQSNSVERAFAKSAVPYRMLGGVRFSDRKEIRDAVAYLQLIENHADRERLLRIINEPKRKIGDKTLEAVSQIAAEQNCSLFEVIENASKYTALSRSAVTLESFAELINRLTAMSSHLSLPDLFDAVLDQSGYRLMLEMAGEEEKDRLDNLDEFKSSIQEYVKNNENPTLTGFLEENALVADVDRYDESADAVVMMTIHSAKGLEFPVVILPGFEDGIFPGMQTIVGGDDDMEEERRLAYVALTRAKEQIYILHTKSRLLYGQTQYNPISRFVSEIPEKYTICEDHAEESVFSRDVSAPKVYLSGGKPVYNSVYGEQKRSGAYGSSANRFPERKTGFADTSATQPAFKKPAAATEQFAPGDRVRHMTFGEGEVLSVRPMGADILYEVMFDKVGTKKLMATYAKLKNA
ncbi:MAG: UvrD-helicase domain-containing protein [Clostridia bacterium]|nr:UvrD-helicase domain-containing protein [Clostridia bacterium]